MVLGDHDLVFFGFGSFHSICQNSHSTFRQTAVTSFSKLYLIAARTAATDIDFNGFHWVSDVVINTDALLLVQTIVWFTFKSKASRKGDHQIVFAAIFKLCLCLLFLFEVELFKI